MSIQTEVTPDGPENPAEDYKEQVTACEPGILFETEKEQVLVTEFHICPVKKVETIA